MKISKEEFETLVQKQLELDKQRILIAEEEMRIKRAYQCEICKEYFEGHTRDNICEDCAKTYNNVRSITILEPTLKENENFNNDGGGGYVIGYQSFNFILHQNTKNSQGRNDILHFNSKDNKFSISIHIIENKLNIFSNRCNIIKTADVGDCNMFYLLPNR